MEPLANFAGTDNDIHDRYWKKKYSAQEAISYTPCNMYMYALARRNGGWMELKSQPLRTLLSLFHCLVIRILPHNVATYE